MISKRVKDRKDGKTSADDALSYGEGLEAGRDRETGEILDKSHRTRLGNFGLVDDGVYAGRADMASLIKLAAVEMQSNCDLNTRVGESKKLAHFVVSFNQSQPSEAVLRDTEDSMLSAMGLDQNHFATFLHNDNGYWHLHIFASRIDKNKHLCNELWRDKTKRDKVCRAIEIRHGLERDNGMHTVDAAGQIVEIPLAERRAQRSGKAPKASDRAQTVERYSGEKSFQSWCNEIRLGDRLKHAKSWQDLHAAATAYGCEIKAKGAGFVVCPTGEKGGITLSKVGLKNLPAKFGAFEPVQPGHAVQVQDKYTPEPTQPGGDTYYKQWKKARDAFRGVKTATKNAQRDGLAAARDALRQQHRAELAAIKAAHSGPDRASTISITKMRHALERTELAAEQAEARQRLQRHLANTGPGNTFRDYLVKQAAAGDDAALALAREYGEAEATEVLRVREADQLKVVAAASGLDDRPAPRLSFTHRVERSGTIIFELGQGRQIIDSALFKQIQLNHAASLDAAAVETSLRFAAAKFGNKLTLTGPAEFQKLAVETAVKKGLGIRFADPALDAYREKLEAERKAPKFQQPQKANTNSTEKTHASNESRHRKQHARQVPPAFLRDRLHHLSEGHMVLDTSRDVLSLQQNVPDRLEQPKARNDHRMQRAAASAVRDQRVNPIPSEHLTKRDALAGLPTAEPPTEGQESTHGQAYAALVEAVRERGGTVQAVREGVPYVGTIEVTADGRFAIQNQGRGAVAIHDMDKLEGSYVSGQKAQITYRNGIGRCKLLEPQQKLARGHG